MPRRREVEKRKIVPDPKYQDVLVAKFVNHLMLHGKKSLAESIVYKTFDLLFEKVKEEPLKVFKKALDNVKPVIEVKSRRVGGSTYQVPVEVKSDRRITLAMRWIIQNAKARSGKNMQEKLADEFIDAYNNRGASIKKKEDTHKMAEANKAFAHYKW